jgi:hypothetical protein
MYDEIVNKHMDVGLVEGRYKRTLEQIYAKMPEDIVTKMRDGVSARKSSSEVGEAASNSAERPAAPQTHPRFVEFIHRLSKLQTPNITSKKLIEMAFLSVDESKDSLILKFKAILREFREQIIRKLLEGEPMSVAMLMEIAPQPRKKDMGCPMNVAGAALFPVCLQNALLSLKLGESKQLPRPCNVVELLTRLVAFPLYECGMKQTQDKERPIRVVIQEKFFDDFGTLPADGSKSQGYANFEEILKYVLENVANTNVVETEKLLFNALPLEDFEQASTDLEKALKDDPAFCRTLPTSPEASQTVFLRLVIRAAFCLLGVVVKRTPEFMNNEFFLVNEKEVRGLFEIKQKIQYVSVDDDDTDGSADGAAGAKQSKGKAKNANPSTKVPVPAAPASATSAPAAPAKAAPARALASAAPAEAEPAPAAAPAPAPAAKAPAAPAKAPAAKKSLDKVDIDTYDAKKVPLGLRAYVLTEANRNMLTPKILDEFKSYMLDYGEEISEDWDEDITKEIQNLLKNPKCTFRLPSGFSIISPKHNLRTVQDAMGIMRLPNSRLNTDHFKKYKDLPASVQENPRKKLYLFLMQVGAELYAVKRGRDSWKTVAGLTLEDCDDMLSSKGKYHDLQ